MSSKLWVPYILWNFGTFWCSNEPTWLRWAQGLLLSPPSLYGNCLIIGYLWVGERAFVLSLGVRECYFVFKSLCVESSSTLIYYLACSPLKLRRLPNYVLLLNFVLFVNFEFSLDLCFFGILDHLSGKCFGAHRLYAVGDGEWGRLSASSYFGPIYENSYWRINIKN